MSDNPMPRVVGPDEQPEAIEPSATGLVVTDDDHATGEQQARENAENESPA